MSAFELASVILNLALVTLNLASVILNLVIASIYAAILWVMVQQRRLMDKQLEAMQAQLREAKRTRMAAHRPILRVEPPTASGLPDLDNIGVGAALDVYFFVHERDTGWVSIVGNIEPIGASEFSREFLPVLTTALAHPALTVTYSDVFGNKFWTLYDIITQSHIFGEGEPTHLQR